MPQSSFKIYNASAGSGKTFSLVRDFLVSLLRSNNPIPFRSLLAITFTNKAVAEMKGRIVKALHDFSLNGELTKKDPLKEAVCERMNLTHEQLKEASRKLLHQLVFNYSVFHVSTIDKFNQDLIRVFAYELKLPSTFDVELDTKAVIRKAVDSLLAKTGDDPELSEALIAFAIEKTDADRSFDISRDLNEVGLLLTNENHLEALDELKEKDLKDFERLRKSLKPRIRVLHDSLKKKAAGILDLLKEHGLEFKDFTRQTLPNHFAKISDGETTTSNLYNNKLYENILDLKLYNKGLDTEKKEIIDSLNSQFEVAYRTIKEGMLHLNFMMNLLNNSGPMSVLLLIKNEMDKIQEEEEIILISEFNTIVSSHIQSQPVPFIYERIGERFDHYYIDEFQDTSILQWNNLIPLAANALSSGPSALTLVGDAKQAIYRWRGGKAEQFIDLYQERTNPFHIKPNLLDLDSNYRSGSSIVSFNNEFFSYIAEELLTSPQHQALYKKSKQNPTKEFEGYVRVDFLPDLESPELQDSYAEQCLTTIQDCLKRGYLYRDICVLVRSHKHGVFLADYLNENSEFPILSSEALLLDKHPAVSFIISFLGYLAEPENLDLQFELIAFLQENNLEKHSTHQVFTELLSEDQSGFFKKLELFQIKFDLQTAGSLNLYELVEYIIYVFNLDRSPNAFLLKLLDFIASFSHSEKQGIKDFLSRYTDQKEKLSISVSEQLDAIRIMTIHKSKGLEFPVVIYPFADLGFHDDPKPKTWVEIDENEYEGFRLAYVNLKSDFQEMGDYAASVYSEYISELELDTTNLIYVALTRAIDELYVISKNPDDAKRKSNKPKFHIVLRDFLISKNFMEQGQSSYSRGKQRFKNGDEAVVMGSENFNKIYSTPKSLLPLQIVTNAAYLWDENVAEAVERGILIHNLLSEIIYERDAEFVFQNALETGVIDEYQANILETQISSLINHKNLKDLFQPENTVFNERDIIRANGQVLRPDRVVIDPEGEVIILDYKTGIPKEEHALQINSYGLAYEEMGLKVKSKKIVYINEEIEIKEIQ